MCKRAMCRRIWKQYVKDLALDVSSNICLKTALVLISLSEIWPAEALPPSLHLMNRSKSLGDIT